MDFECSLWPDNWFGISLSNCCVMHDLGGSDFELLQCVVTLNEWLLPIGIMMFIGLKIFGPIYKVLKMPKESTMSKQEFYASLRKSKVLFRNNQLSQGQVNNIEQLLAAFVLYGDGEKSTLSYGLGTVYGEVGSKMQPVRESFATTDKSARRKLRHKKYGQPEAPYGHVYYGRGYVQLTWKDNYEKSSKDAGVDLVKYPDTMLEAYIAAKILWKGLIDGRWNGKGKGIQYYLKRNDLKNARRTVNITDKWQKFASFYKAFDEAVQHLDLDAIREELKQPAQKTQKFEPIKNKPTEFETEKTMNEPSADEIAPPAKSVFAWIFKLIGFMFGKK